MSGDFLGYEATYRLKGRTLAVRRAFEDRTPDSTCSPEMGRAYKQFAIRAAKNVKAQVVYK
jgi:hypothetical protein